MSTVAAVADLCFLLVAQTAAAVAGGMARTEVLVAATEAGSVLIRQQCSIKTMVVLDSPELPAVAVAVAAE
jgi:hypothetical protein